MQVHRPLRTAARILFRGAPIEAQLVVTRRCNLSCGYCSEYDDHSAQVPAELLRKRIDALHRLGVVNIAMLGGEPLLHSKIGELVRYAARGAQVSMTSNAFLLSAEAIEGLNRAGLANMQVSIDALRVDTGGYIQKTLRPLLPKLRRLRRLARFDVHLTVVLCEATRGELTELVGDITELGFPVSINPVHDASGQVQVQGPAFVEAWDRCFQGSQPFSMIDYEYGRRLLEGERPAWHCRAGRRFLYIDEFGNVQFCSAQRGRPDRPLADCTRADLRRWGRQRKGCEPGCALLCVYRDSQLDNAPLGLARALWRTRTRARAGGA